MDQHVSTGVVRPVVVRETLRNLVSGSLLLTLVFLAAAVVNVG